MEKRMYKISEEQYARLTENAALSSSVNNKPETVVKTTKDNLNNATSTALNKNASAIEITDGGNIKENKITKKELKAEARKEWKNNTEVVKLSELLNR